MKINNIMVRLETGYDPIVNHIIVSIEVHSSAGRHSLREIVRPSDLESRFDLYWEMIGRTLKAGLERAEQKNSEPVAHADRREQ